MRRVEPTAWSESPSADTSCKSRAPLDPQFRPADSKFTDPSANQGRQALGRVPEGPGGRAWSLSPRSPGRDSMQAALPPRDPAQPPPTLLVLEAGPQRAWPKACHSSY